MNFTLLDKLKITTKESILLQQIKLVNNKSDFLVFLFTVFNELAHGLKKSLA